MPARRQAAPRLLSGRRVSPLVVEGLREWQRRGAPDVVLLEIAEQQAARWLAEIVAMASLRARIRTWAR